MKKTIQLLFLLFIVFSFNIVNAAYAYVWTVNGEALTRGGDPVLNGQAKWIESNEYSGGILVLNNYNGSEIKIECKGTGMNQVFAVRLIGNNTITSDNIGFLTTDKVEFIGDGTLTITAPVAMSSYDEIELPNVKSQITIYGKDKVVKEEVKSIDTKEEVVTDKEKETEDVTTAEPKIINKYVYLVIIGVAVICLFALGILILKISKKRS